MKLKFISVFLSILMVVSLMPMIVYAETEIPLTSSVADISISDLYLDEDHTIPLGDNSVTKDTEIFASLDVRFTPGSNPTSSDQVYYYDLPDALSFTTVQNGKLYDGTKIAGEYTIENNRVKFSFNDAWLKQNSSNIHTNFSFSFFVTEETIDEGGPKEVEFPGIGTIVVDTVSSTATVSKTNSLAHYAENGYIEYTITLNAENNIRSASVTDTLDILTSGVAKRMVDYVPGSFKLDGVDVSDNVSLTAPSTTRTASFVYPASGGVPLSAGKHTLTYLVKYDEKDLYNGARREERKLKNTASWITDGIKLDDVTSSLNLKSTHISKEYSEVKFDSVNNKEYVEWTIVINDSNVPMDISGYTLTDTLFGGHTFSDIRDSLRMVADDGTDITNQMIYLSESADQIKLQFPANAGRKKYTMTYRTDLFDNHQSIGYSNGALLRSTSGRTVGIKNGEWGEIGFGSKELDTSSITREMLSGGGSANGQADWKITIPGNVYSIPSAFDIIDWLSEPTDKIWLKRSSVDHYDADVTPDTPVLTYTDADGSSKTLTLGTDFRMYYKVQADTGAERFDITFRNTDATRQAFKSGFEITYSTQSVGSAAVGTYRNRAQFNYQGEYVAEFTDRYDVVEESNLYKVASEITRLPDGRYRIVWEAVINGNNTDGKPTSPNVDLENEEVVIYDTLPAGTVLSMNGNRPEFFRYRVDSVNGNVRAWTDIPLWNEGRTKAQVINNDDGTQTIELRWRVKEEAYVNGGKRLMATVRYATITDAFDPGDYSSKSITNNISAATPTRDLGEAQATATVTNSAVNKTADYIAGSGNQVKYTIHVNDGALELNEGNPMKLWDQFDANLSLVDGTMKVYLGDTNQELSGWTIAGETVTNEAGNAVEKYTLGNLPDATHLRVEYTTVVAGNIGDTVNTENTAVLVGTLDYSSTATQEVQIQKSSGSASGASGKIEVIKVDADNINTKLPDAEFKLYSVNLATGAATLEATKQSDENGSVLFDTGKNGLALQLDTLYYFQETKAPTGYLLDDTKRYFILKGNDYDEVLAAATTLLNGAVPGSAVSYYAYDKPEEQHISVEKKWFTYDGQLVTDEGVLAVMPEISVNIMRTYQDGGTEKSEVFETVTLSSENGWKDALDIIGTDVFAPNGERYTYTAEEVNVPNEFEDSVEVVQEGDTFSIVVSNTEKTHPVELPETGGNGIALPLAVGSFMMACAVIAGFMSRRKHKAVKKHK